MPTAETAARKAWAPPSPLPAWQWIEQNVELGNTSAFPGKVSFDFFPCSKILLNYMQDKRVRRIIATVSAQSGKTETSIMFLLWMIREDPRPTMWTMAGAEMCEEFAKKRLWPAIYDCDPVRELAPTDRSEWTKGLCMFSTMNVMLRGSNSRGRLKSDPVAVLINDERSDWKKGAISTIRQRQTTFSDSVEVSMGTAGVKDDEFHADWKEGSQTFLHWTCPHCQHSQTFRFGKKESVFYPNSRKQGGFVWDENDTTRPGGVWDYEAVKATVRYECEKCGHLFSNSDKMELVKSIHQVHRNPKALPENISIHWWKAYMPWAKCDWGEIVVEFLQAMDAVKCGELEPLKTFVQETLGEPWEDRTQADQSEILDRCGEYDLGQFWILSPGVYEPETVPILTIDRQNEYFVWLIRQWRKQGESKLIDCGTISSYDDLRTMQLDYKIRNSCVWGDDGGHDVTKFRQTCLRWGWNAMKGEKFSHYTIIEGPNKYLSGWRWSEADPGIGTAMEGRQKMPLLLWSNDWFKERLYLFMLKGLGPTWSIPRNVPTDYIKQVMAVERRQKKGPRGQVEYLFYSNGPDHFADCELEQLVVADIGGMTRKLNRPKSG